MIEPRRLLIVGAKFGEIYLNAFMQGQAAGAHGAWELAGLLANGSPRSRALAHAFGIPLFTALAEHAVSVRLAMEEMEPLCAPDTMGVSEFMAIKQRGSVQHLGSLVRGRLAGGLGPWHAFLRLFPAVTASGIPKIAALDSIRRHETSVRGLYSGCVFMTDGSGAMDAALVLRSVYRTGSRCWLQAGAGVVPLSSPEREFEETSEKLASVPRHLRRR